jgi:aminopeptidase N
MEGMKRYYYEWRYKHPTPQDFKRVMEKVSGIELDWYFEQFVGTINTIDYGIKNVTDIDGKTSIVLERIGDMPMPIDVVVTFKDGSKKWYNIPMRIMRGSKGKDMYGIERIDKKSWPWVYPEYKFLLDVPMNQVVEIEIDPSTRLADLDRENNVYPNLVDQHPVLFDGK